MKNVITYLKTLWGAWGNLLSNDVICDRRITRGVLCFLGKLARRIYSFGCSQDILGAPQSLHSSPSGLNAKMKQKGNMEQKEKMSTSCLLLNSYLPLTCPLFASLSLVSRQSDLDTYAAGKTNNASGARVAREWMKYAAAILLVFTIGVGNAWGATTVTYSYDGDATPSVSGTAPTGSTAALSGSYTDNSGWMQCANSGSAVLTLSGYQGYKITAITIHVKSNSKSGTGSFSVTAGSTTIASIASNAFNNAAWNGSWNNSGVDKALTMSNSSYEIKKDENVVFSLNVTSSGKSLYINSWAITYEAAAAAGPSLTATPTSLDWGTVAQNASIAAKTFSVSGSNLTGAITIAAPSGYTVSPTSITPVSKSISATDVTVTPNTATAGTFNGNVTISGGGLASNVTVGLTMTVQASHTVTWMVNGSEHATTQVADGSKPTFPSTPSSCDGTSTTFVGWTATPWSGKLDDVSAKTIYTSGSAMPNVSGPVTYHAVFAKETSTLTPVANTWTRITSTSQLTDGATVMLVQYYSDYAINNTPGATSCTANAEITNSNTALRWIAVKSGSKWKFKTSSNHYLSTSALDNNTTLELDATYDEWTISADNGGTTGSNNTYTNTNCFRLNNGSDLQYYSGVFKLYTWSLKYSSAYPFYIYIQKTTGSTTYSQYLTTCCTSWSDPTFSYNTYSLTAGGAHATKTITGTTHGMLSFESSNTGVITVDAETGEVTPVGAGTAYVIAHWTEADGYCAKDLNSSTFTVSGNVTVTFKKNGGTGTDDQTQSVPYNTATALKTLAQVGYTAPSCKEFYGWADSQAKADAGTRDYTDGQSVTLTTGKTLYAVWKDITYTVSDGTMVGVASHSYSANPITCGNTLTITCAADGDHKGNPTVTATGTHGTITVVSATCVTIANVTSAIAVSISYAEKTNVTATWNVNNGSVTGGGTTTQKEGSTFTFPNVTSTDCGTFLGWTNAANSSYSSTSGKPTPFYSVGSTIVLNENTQFYAVYSKVSDDAVADVLYHHADDGTDLDDDDHTGVTATGSGLGAYSSGSYYLKFDGIGDYIIFELDGVPTSFNMKLKTMTGGSYPYNVGFTLYESDSKSGPWTAIGSEVTASGGSQTFEIDITTAASFSKRVLKVEMTTRNINVGGGEITINGLRAAINYTTNPGCVDWVLDAINVTTAPTKTTYNECEAFDPTGMAVTATMKENGNPSNTTTKDVAGYTWTPTQFLTPGNSIPVTISYTEKDVTKTTTTNVKVTDLPNYTITFHDGDNTFTWTQSNHCDACDLDSRTGSLACGEYTFAGWSTSSTSYDDVSATISTWVSGSYTPTANTHLYAVYRKGAAPAEFTANCIGGTFTIGTKNGGSTIISHAANVGSFNSYEYGVANSDYTEDQLGKFLFEKVGENTYKISLERNDDYGGGIKRFYIAPDDYSAGAIEFLETYDANQCKWKVIAGTSGSWRIYTEFRNSNITKDYGIAGRGNDGATPRFRLVPTGNINGSDNYDVELSPVTVPVYQSNPNCASTYTITFNTHGGTFIQGNYAYETETTSGLSGETTSKFPSATLSGCTFAGWKEGSAFEETTSSAAEDDMSDAPYGLYAADADLSVSSNKTYHAVYHYYDDDIEFDPIEGGTYHMYATDGGVKHFCSGTPGTSFGTLTSTTDCEEVVDVVITPGTGENAGKYKINIGGYDVTPELTNTGLKRGTFWWNISEVSENLYHITADGAESGRSLNYYSAMSSFTHYKDNGGSQAKDISFGRCRQHHWTSEPTLTPLIILGATSNITITSTKDQAVKSNTKLKVSATHFGTTTTINLTCNIAGVTLSPSSLTTGADGEMVEQEVDVIYTPTSYPAALSDGITSGTITAQDANVTPLSTATRSVKVRNLPAQFVIAAKAGNEWVALTAKVGGMATQDAIPIMVDNTTMPTKATVAMNTSEYSLLGLPSTNSRFATNGGAVHLYSSQTSKVLNSSTSTSTATYINTGATAANAATSDNCLFYEWKLISNDLVHYTITNSNATAGLESNRILGYSASTGKWGMYSIGVNQDIFLLPIEEVLTDLNVEVMEWGATSMALRFEGAAPTSLKVTLGGSTSAAKTLTAVGEGSDLWKIDGLTLTSHDCEVMQLTDGTDASKGSLIRKPILVNSSVNGSAYRTALTDETCASCDIVILNGGKLTADQSKDNHTDFAKIHIYPGGKLVLDGNSLGVKQKLYVRGGYSWLNTSTYALPELYIKGNIKFNGSAKIIYDYYIQNYKYYQFTLPYTVPLSQVTDEAGIDNFPVWVKHYNGALRAVNANATSWEWYEGENFEAGIGYIIAARPRQVDKVKNRPLSIIRFPLTNNAFTGNSTADYGEATKSVSTTAHGIAGYKAGTVTANNVGWNFIGNPFMATWKGDIGHQQLVQDPDEEHWNGSYKWADGATKYITVMSPEDGTDYDQYVASTTELKPFFPFYFQETAEGGSGTLEFANTGRQKKTPAAIRANDLREAFVQIDMTDGTSQDQTGVYVGDKYSDELDFDDMQKMFGSLTTKPKVWIMHDETRMAFEAMSEERAASNVPVGYRAPVEGEYTFALSNYSELDNVESVLLNDNELGIYNYDLLSSDYEFESGTVLYNDTRFTLRVVLKDENTGTPTGTETINLNSEEPLKFIYHDKMYILRGGVIYDATGKKVGEINK